jgi:hypothetical protein
MDHSVDFVCITVAGECIVLSSAQFSLNFLAMIDLFVQPFTEKFHGLPLDLALSYHNILPRFVYRLINVGVSSTQKKDDSWSAYMHQTNMAILFGRAQQFFLFLDNPSHWKRA